MLEAERYIQTCWKLKVHPDMLEAERHIQPRRPSGCRLDAESHIHMPHAHATCWDAKSHIHMPHAHATCWDAKSHIHMPHAHATCWDAESHIQRCCLGVLQPPLKGKNSEIYRFQGPGAPALTWRHPNSCRPTFPPSSLQP
eukprot:jgi/Botrbrau1/5340/Bobra.0346s0014.1